MSDQPNNPQYLVLHQPQHQQRLPRARSVEPIIVPPRVDKAIEVLAFFTRKAAPILAISDTFTEFHEGQKLSPAEDAAIGAAADVLHDYLSGRLKLDEFELKRMRDGKSKRRRSKKNSVMIATCPQCRGVGDDCGLCGGDKNVAIVRQRAVM